MFNFNSVRGGCMTNTNYQLAIRTISDPEDFLYDLQEKGTTALRNFCGYLLSDKTKTLEDLNLYQICISAAF
jgi:hypothetical protein